MSSICAVSSSLYAGGSVVIHNPVQSSSIFLVVVLICACLEYLFTLANDVNSRFFNRIFETISEEILVVGVLSLLLSFGSSLPSTIPESWCKMIQWTHVCLLFMGVFFVIIMALLVLMTFLRFNSMKKFESRRIDQKSFELKAHEVRFQKAHQQFRLCLLAYRLEEEVEGVCLADYAFKTEKEQLETLGDLTWRSWLALTVMIIVNACRTRVPALVNGLQDYRDTVDVATYVVLMGWVPVAIFLYLSHLLNRRLDQFCEKRQGAQHSERPYFDDAIEPGVQEPLRPSELEDPRSFLLWQTPDSTIGFLQVLFIALVWYGAVFCLNMLYITFNLNSIYLTIGLLVGAFLPIAVFIIKLPETLSVVCFLSTLGTCFNEPRIRAMVAVGKGEAISTEVALQAGDGEGVTPSFADTVTSKKSGIVAIKKAPLPLHIGDHAMLRLAESFAEKDGRQQSVEMRDLM